MLPDIHTPNHNAEAISAVIRFIKYFKPHRLIQLGDFCDFDSLSRFDLHNVNHFVTLHEELESSNHLLDQIDKAVPRACEKVMIGGNHEDRYHQAKAKFMFVPDKVSRSMVEWRASWAHEYRLDERGWKWCEYGHGFTFGKVHYTHGWYTGDSAMKRMAGTRPGKNLVTGHLHCHDVYGSIDENMQPIEAETIGTLSRFDLAYLRGKPPTNWLTAFMVIYTRDNGLFNKYLINIIDGGFVFNGLEF